MLLLRTFDQSMIAFFGPPCEAWPPLRPASDARVWLREKLRLLGLTLCPPLRPASAASPGFCEKLRFSWGTLSPPLRAIALCFSGSIEAKPRVDVADFLVVSTALIAVLSLSSLTCFM
ncbi:hypothetical protein MPC1_3160004 [Methylocella tundrae]|nr:hypothetical protein MPC1_3160004 [Methylocella tundrae]